MIMTRYLFLLLFVSITVFSQHKIETKKVSTTLSKHGITIQDDYTWLENTSNKEVIDWITLQNNVSEQKLTEVVKNHNFSFKIKDYDYLSTYSLPSKNGKYFYNTYRIDKNKPGVLYYRESLNDLGKPLVDPYDVYKDENVVLLGYYPSKNSKYLAFRISPNGSDRHEIKFRDFVKNELVKYINPKSVKGRIYEYAEKVYIFSNIFSMDFFNGVSSLVTGVKS